ncbi:hypothetical protein Ahy_A09g044142 [Arachis hypogaea]|uniref:Uncharacterized protein n=1 Tax=Arachis hypogaea TaxID=3818 RepID=A0A445BJU7_ARAHY|nr:hypothetical protein Ahy_A09g044142 [Arachis hypogaea]
MHVRNIVGILPSHPSLCHRRQPSPLALLCVADRKRLSLSVLCLFGIGAVIDLEREEYGLPGDEEDSGNEHDGDTVDELPYLYNQPSRETRNFHDLLEDGEQELCPGCSKFSKLSFLVRLYHIKSMCGVSDKAFGMILELLADAFEHARIPSTVREFYENNRNHN